MVSASLKYLFDPRGRFSRSDMLPIAIGMVVFELLASHVASGPDLLFKALYAVMIWVGLSATIKRLHDTGHSGWWVLGGAAFICMWTALIAVGGLFALGREVLTPGSTGHFIILGFALLPPLSMTLWLHLAPGEIYKNEYGMPPLSSGSLPSVKDEQNSAAANRNSGIAAA
jgi:uncharacterized membrane protein YhaH (DUF805 family)